MTKERLKEITNALSRNDSLTPIDDDPGAAVDLDARHCWLNELAYQEPFAKELIKQLASVADKQLREMNERGASSVNAPMEVQQAFAALACTEYILWWVLNNWSFVIARLEDC